MKLNVDKTKVTTLSRKTNNLIYGYKRFYSTVPRTHSLKDLGVYLDSKPYFYNHVNYIFSHCIEMLVLIRSVTFNCSALGGMLILFFELVRSEVEYASVVWNSITSTDANKLQRIQQKFTALCFKCFFLQADYCYGFALE
jgi:hypothetical protein